MKFQVRLVRKTMGHALVEVEAGDDIKAAEVALQTADNLTWEEAGGKRAMPDRKW